MELVRKENLFETDKLKSGVKPSIRRTGAKIIDFLVFRKYFGRIVAKKRSIVVSIPACHAGDRGSIPRRGAMLLLGTLWLSNHWSFKVNQLIRKIT